MCTNTDKHMERNIVWHVLKSKSEVSDEHKVVLMAG